MGDASLWGVMLVLLLMWVELGSSTKKVRNDLKEIQSATASLEQTLRSDSSVIKKALDEIQLIKNKTIGVEAKLQLLREALAQAGFSSEGPWEPS